MLLVVLMVMLTLLGLGVTTMWLTNTNLQVGGTMNLRTQALYVAEAGLERARSILNAPVAPDLDLLLQGTGHSNDEVPTDVDASGYPNGVGAILLAGAAPLSDVPFPPAAFGRSAGTAETPTASSMGNYTVWIRNDLAELRLADMTTDTNDTVVIRSRGVASDGRTNVVLEVTMMPSGMVTNGVTPGSGLIASDCISGKNACDDNSSTQYGITFSGVP